MPTAPSRNRQHVCELALLAVIAIAFWLLLRRNLGLNPAIFSDEWFYSKMSRLDALSTAMVPSYLYLWVFRASNACGEGFLDCVRIGNALFFVGAAPFVYLIARELTSARLALFAALLSLLAPLNLYTTFFMPESMYYFGFWVLSWIALTRTSWGSMMHALVSGAVLGLLSLVKVHAVFLVPALCLFLFYRNFVMHEGTARVRAALLSLLVAALAMFAVKFGLGYAFAGKGGLSLLGSFYGSGAQQAAGHRLAALLAPAIFNARAHLMALALLLVLPLATLLQTIASKAARAQAGPALTLLQVYALLMLGAALGMTVLFTASIADSGPDEVLRLHLRYYSFVFPLLFIMGAASIGRAPATTGPVLTWSIALALAALLVACPFILPGYSPRISDGPDIVGLAMSRLAGPVVVGLDLLILFLWARRSKYAAPLFMFVALPAVIVAANQDVHRYLKQLVHPFPGDQAGEFARRYVPPAEHKQIMLATTNLAELYRLQFHLDDKDAGLLDLPAGAPIEPYQLPVHHKWLLVVGKHALPPGIKPVVATPEYALVRLEPRGRTVALAELGVPIPNQVVTAVEGLAGSEGWGRWSNAKQVVVHFKNPLPRQVTVVLKANAYGVNATLPFTMRIGSASTTFRLGLAQQEVALPLTTSGAERTLAIEVPRPQAPTGRPGLPSDIRKLGIAISRIQIDENVEPALSAK